VEKSGTLWLGNQAAAVLREAGTWARRGRFARVSRYNRKTGRAGKAALKQRIKEESAARGLGRAHRLLSITAEGGGGRQGARGGVAQRRSRKTKKKIAVDYRKGNLRPSSSRSRAWDCLTVLLSTWTRGLRLLLLETLLKRSGGKVICY